MDEPKNESAEAQGPAAAPPPLTPVTVVFPRKRNGFAWQTFWFGVLFAIAGALPWHGVEQHEVLLEDGRVITLNQHRFETELNQELPHFHQQKPDEYPGPPAAIRAFHPEAPAKSIGQLVVIITGLMLAVGSLVWVWHGRILDMQPLILAMVFNFMALWFSFGANTWDMDATAGTLERSATRSFAALGDLVGNAGAILKTPTDAGYSDLVDAVSVLGPGAWLAMLTDIFLVLALVLHIVGSRKAEAAAAGAAGDPKKKGAAARRPSRPGSKSPSFGKKEGDDKPAEIKPLGGDAPKPEGDAPQA